ncbi:MAG: hypothetical protein EOM59_13610 [Clostridia bacterium]|nr:hypothetical protein [Clostridia bacterium]
MAKELGELMVVKIDLIYEFEDKVDDRRRIAFSIRGKHYANLQELEEEFDERGIDSEDFSVFTIDELCNDLNDGEYPENNWTTYVYIG